MKRIDKTLILSMLVCLLPIGIGLLLYGKLPANIPIHWNSQGVVDNTAPKAAAVFLLPLGMALLHLLVQFVMRHDPKRQNASPALRILSLWVAPACSILCCTVSYLAGLGVGVDVPLCASIFIGFLFVMLGNYLPKCKQNYTMGIRLPWTLHDPDNWNKTHHLAGCVWVIGGLTVLFSAFFRVWWIQLAVIVLVVLIPCVYSFLLYRKTNKSA